MIFTSFNFLIFFPLVAIFYWVTPARFRWLTLLILSYFFYINLKPVYDLLTAGITISTFFFTKMIDKTKVENRKKNLMIINIIIILLPLFFFKYFSVINNGIVHLLENYHLRWPLPEIKLILPIGISFYTFMAIGYTLDVYYEEIEAEKNIGILALFISFFPLVLSGPIERAKNMLPQFRMKIKLDYFLAVKGFKLMLWGYFMKLVVANRIGLYIDAVYRHIPLHNGTTIFFASFLHPFQVYTDLGGYSLIAIGTANIMGINVMCNFRRPFFAMSMAEFWRRWHISLITWLTDYVYTPLSFTFRKLGIGGIVLALMVTFFISGIWHGAAITFIVWGLIQGILLSLEALSNKKRGQIEKRYGLNNKIWYLLLCCFSTYLFFTASLIFGKSANIAEAFLVYKKIFTNPGNLFFGEPTIFIFGTLSIMVVLLKDFVDEFMPERFLFFENKNKFIRIMSYSSVIILIILIGVLDGGQFIYFQF